jgi:hypothetical protein
MLKLCPGSAARLSLGCGPGALTMQAEYNRDQAIAQASKST